MAKTARVRTFTYALDPNENRVVQSTDYGPESGPGVVTFHSFGINRRKAVLQFLSTMSPSEVYGITESSGTDNLLMTAVYYSTPT